MDKESETGQPRGADTGAKEYRRRRIELFSALTLLCFGLINYLDLLREKEDLAPRIPSPAISKSADSVPRREFDEFKERVFKTLDEHGKDIREMRVVMLNSKAAKH